MWYWMSPCISTLANTAFFTAISTYVYMVHLSLTVCSSNVAKFSLCDIGTLVSMVAAENEKHSLRANQD